MALQLRTLVVLVPAARQKLTTVYSFYLTGSVALVRSPWVLHNVVKQSHLQNKKNSKNSHYVLNSDFLKTLWPSFSVLNYSLLGNENKEASKHSKREDIHRSKHPSLEAFLECVERRFPWLRK